MKQTRREFLKKSGLAATALAIPFSMTTCSAGKRPNIIFIMSDDHAKAAMSCYGSRFIKTPNLDRIAAEGVQFTKSFVTNSICAPSRAVLLTGKYSHMNGLRDNRDKFDGSQMTFTKLLRDAGYHTSMIGKWHLKTDPTGFDEWRILIGQGEYYNPVFDENGKKNKYTGYVTDLITDFAIESLEKRKGDKPFCMMIHHKAPHRNWMPNSKYFDAFKDTEIPLPDNYFDDYEGRSEAAKSADMRVEDMYLSFDTKLRKGDYDKETGTGGSRRYATKVADDWERSLDRLTDEQRAAWDAHYNAVSEEFRKAKLEGQELSKWKYQRYMKDYLRCVLSVDESIGRILDYLDNKGLTDNTLVVYTSDQGFFLGEHGWYDKRFMYEESLSMPLVMRYPKEIPAGTVLDKMVLNLDFAPTFLDYVGIRIPEEMQGKSLRRMAGGGEPNEWRDSIYYHYYEYPHGWHDAKRHYGIRTSRYKLIHFYHDIDAWELYDLKEDPHEMRNLYDDPDYSDIVDQLKNELARLQKKYRDTSMKSEDVSG
ncbi:MAG: sulfatase [candidate division KSB1 bacterium]|jgi:arylsulfatase A-like enzyme|nr:sulfatase [candidate division KSB1 bacterium]